MGWWKVWNFVCWVPWLNIISSIRTHIHGGDIDYAVTTQSWPNFLYAGYSCDPLDLKKGLFKSKILVNNLSLYSTLIIMTWYHRHSRPSSPHHPWQKMMLKMRFPKMKDPPQMKHARRDMTMATCLNNATLCGLKSFTLWSIAYIAVQVHQCIWHFTTHNIIISLIIFLNQVQYALSSGTSWRPSNIDFSHIDFYVAIVDFFEDTPALVA